MNHTAIFSRWVFAAVLLTFAAPATGLTAEQSPGKTVSGNAAAKKEKARLDRIAALSWKNTTASAPLTVAQPELTNEKRELFVPPGFLKVDKPVPLEKEYALSWSLELESHASPEANLRYNKDYRYEDFLRSSSWEQRKGEGSFLPGKAEDILPVQEIKLGMQLAF